MSPDYIDHAHTTFKKSRESDITEGHRKNRYPSHAINKESPFQCRKTARAYAAGQHLTKRKKQINPICGIN